MQYYPCNSKSHQDISIWFFQHIFKIYRVHEYPVEEKIRSFLGFLSSLGYNLHLDIKDTKPKTIQQLLEFLKDKKEYKILSSLLLRNMQKAKYIPVPTRARATTKAKTFFIIPSPPFLFFEYPNGIQRDSNPVSG